MSTNALAPESANGPTAEGRAADRSNLFVIATIYSAAGSTPVRVRNLSPSGALVEGSVLPLPGSRVRLSRGSLSVSGEAVWSAEGRAGLRFSSAISVPDWLPGATSAGGQHRIDEVVFRAKRGDPAARDAPPSSVPLTSSDVAVELAALACSLTRLCNQLADDAYVAAHFPGNLQIIEATAERLDRLARAVLTP